MNDEEQKFFDDAIEEDFRVFMNGDLDYVWNFDIFIGIYFRKAVLE
jgi:hypothetical protein